MMIDSDDDEDDEFSVDHAVTSCVMNRNDHNLVHRKSTKWPDSASPKPFCRSGVCWSKMTMEVTGGLVSA
eukprot:3510847-Amphidinium_carterae.1